MRIRDAHDDVPVMSINLRLKHTIQEISESFLMAIHPSRVRDERNKQRYGRTLSKCNVRITSTRGTQVYGTVSEGPFGMDIA